MDWAPTVPVARPALARESENRLSANIATGGPGSTLTALLLVVSTTSVLGYAPAGYAGALSAPAIASSPSRAFILLGAGHFDALRSNAEVQALLTGAGPAVIGAIHEAADARSAEALALMLELGSGHDARDESGERPLHAAAHRGNANAVRLLLAAGAEVDARGTRFEATPLAFATVGSGEQEGEPGDWIRTVRLLLKAGASRNHVWITGKPPSEQVADVLHSCGIAPERPGGSGGDEGESTDASDIPGAPAPLGDDVLSEIARHIEAACRESDLELLGSLLDPEVRWTGTCRTSAQGLDWYKHALADGTKPTVETVEVDRDAVVPGLTLTRPAVEARPAPPHRLYQVFTIEGTRIVEIRGYPDRRSALART